MIISRYIGCLKPSLPVYYSDFLVLGSGIAGLFTALKAAEYGQVIVLTKKNIKDSNTDMAQGGIAAAVNEEDSPFLHLEDTLEAGAGLCNINAVDVLVREGPDRVRELMTAGAAFDMKNGSVDLTREGAHSRPRILHAADATGEAIRIALEQRCLENPRIEVKEQHFLIDFLGNQAGTECYGALVHNALNGEEYLFIARAVIVATGGAGQLYQYTTNPEVATADGMAACYRIGCELEDLEFIQFHPTVLYSSDNQRFLVSESVRGEGGILLNHAGERFMARYHHQGDLAPRDVVSRAILSELFSYRHRSMFTWTCVIYPEWTGAFPIFIKPAWPRESIPWSTWCRFHLRLTTLWAESRPIWPDGPASMGFMLAGKWPAPAFTEPIAWPATHCWKGLCLGKKSWNRPRRFCIAVC